VCSNKRTSYLDWHICYTRGKLSIYHWRFTDWNLRWSFSLLQFAHIIFQFLQKYWKVDFYKWWWDVFCRWIYSKKYSSKPLDAINSQFELFKIFYRLEFIEKIFDLAFNWWFDNWYYWSNLSAWFKNIWVA
jgi:hypothetical protein